MIIQWKCGYVKNDDGLSPWEYSRKINLPRRNVVFNEILENEGKLLSFFIQYLFKICKYKYLFNSYMLK